MVGSGTIAKAIAPPLAVAQSLVPPAVSSAASITNDKMRSDPRILQNPLTVNLTIVRNVIARVTFSLVPGIEAARKPPLGQGRCEG